MDNGGFENGLSRWSASAGTFSLVSSGSNLLTGRNSATWDAAASTNTLSYNAVTIPNGLYSSNGVAECRIQTPSGTATHTLQVYDGSNVIASVDIVSSTSPLLNRVNFVFPTSGTVTIRLLANADEPTIAIDDCYLGDAANLTEVQPQDIFSATIANDGSVSLESADWINGDCTNADPRVCTFNSGIFTAAPNCVTDGEDVTAVSSSSVSIDQNSVITRVHCQKSSADQPITSLKPDQIANSWSGYHANDCSFVLSGTSYSDFTADSTCTFTERTNLNFGTVTSALDGSSNKLPGLVFTPKRAGRYYICVNPSVSSASNVISAMRLYDGTNTLMETDIRMQSNNAGPAMRQILCGILVADDTSEVTIKLQGKIGASTFTTSASESASTIEWSIFKISETLPSPLIKQSYITTTEDVWVTINAQVRTDSSGSIVRQSGDEFSIAARTGTGDVTLGIASGTFSDTPYCYVTGYLVTPFRFCQIYDTTPISTTAVRVRCANDGGIAVDEDFFIKCEGPR